MNKFKLQLLIEKAKQAHAAKMAQEAAEKASQSSAVAVLQEPEPAQQEQPEPTHEETQPQIHHDAPTEEIILHHESGEDQHELPDIAEVEALADAESVAESTADSEAGTEPIVSGSISLGDPVDPSASQHTPVPLEPGQEVQTPKTGGVSSFFGRSSTSGGGGSSVGKVFTDSGAFHPVIPGFEYNEKQLQAIELAMRGKSINLIGAAGTGKTTTTREIIGQVVKLPQCTLIQRSTKYLTAGSPGVVIISFTNKAVNNIKKFLPEELKRHCLTIHSLLEFKPVRSFDEMEINERDINGNFLPTYFRGNKLPHISIVIVEESSMVGAEDHWKWVIDALPHPEQTQFIFLGDLNQLPPIFGPSVLGFKLLELPTVELTHVYRQALESPIITLAHKIREGRVIGPLAPVKENGGGGGFLDDRGEHGKVTIHPWKKKLQPVPACKTTQNFVTKLHEQGEYDPDSDIILCPFNKTFGTVELNKGIADYLGKLRDATVYEVCSRGMFSYWAVGDRVLVDRQEAIITKIEETPHYSGKQPDDPSKTLNRWGKDPKHKKAAKEEDEDKELLLARGHDILSTLSIDGEEEGKNTASHTITVEICDTGLTRVLSASGDVNAMQFAYALTVHKSQGSEWRKVFIFLHYSHNTMLTRELMYTAVTRARQELFIICEPDRGEIFNSLTRAAKSPEIKGVTLAEKAEYFKAKKKTMQRLADRQAELAEMEEDNYDDESADMNGDGKVDAKDSKLRAKSAPAKSARTPTKSVVNKTTRQ